MSSPRSVRFDDDVLARLDGYLRSRPRASLSAVVNDLVAEGLRLLDHPGIVFRDGPAGRRAGLADGPDVWEVVTALHDIRADDAALADEALIAELVGVTGLTARQIRIALRYYAAHRDEVDALIGANRELADREERLWRAERAVLSPSP